MNSFDELLAANKEIIEAYRGLGAKQSFMHPEVKHKVTEDSDVVAHHFDPSEAERVHEHLVSLGYKQAGASDVSGPATETRYVHPKTKSVAYIGKNKHTGWLDIQK